ncbi:potassium/proton antiporter [Stieleria bergensis]|uniref:Potassium/proton antiporter n=1 Tax=Stieleria bergensis TaxID=2528025 RepID=A0A517SPI0_9BACT|nr:potassium/proton antiporter [Planctomycetes bacterium SV_7m_r]
MGDFHIHITSTLGLLLAASLAAGVLADLVHLPKVTAYLLVGLLVGPSALNLVEAEHVDLFEPLLQLAMALVLFNLGCEFTFSKVRRIARHCLPISIAEIGFTTGAVALCLMIFGASLPKSILLGCLAVATAPATTILVLKEFRSEGPVTESTGFLVALNNFACIVMFEIALFVTTASQDISAFSALQNFGQLMLDIAGSIFLGIAGGLVISYGCGFLAMKRWLVLLVAAVTFLHGVDESFDIPYMLTFLMMGVTVANTSDYKQKIVDELDHLSGLMAVLFFVVHGTHLDAQAFLAVGLLGGIYIAARMGGKWLGVYVAAKMTRQPKELRRWGGSCLFSQAGAAIGLSTIAAHRMPELGGEIQTIILGSVVVFEIIGPLFIRKALLETGEIPLAQAIHHTNRTPMEQLNALIDRFRTGLDSESNQATPTFETNVQVKDLLRKAKGIHQGADFDEVISHIEHSHDNTYPVVDDQLQVVGIIRYQLLSNVLFDHSANKLVRAEDLASAADALLYLDAPASRAVELFNEVSDDCIPVITREEPNELCGVVRRSDVMHALITQNRKQKKGNKGKGNEPTVAAMDPPSGD